MKQTRFITSIIGFASIVCGCSGSSTDMSASDSSKASQVNVNKINTMAEYNLDGTIEVGGKKYEYEFAFNNDKSLPIITTEDDFKYYDNRVKLYIRHGNETIYEHTFTKESFSSLIPEKDYKRSVLAGFNFNYMQKDKHDKFYFIAVVGDPDETSDISYSIGISIDKIGAITTSIVNSIDVEPISDEKLNQDPALNDA